MDPLLSWEAAPHCLLYPLPERPGAWRARALCTRPTPLQGENHCMRGGGSSGGGSGICKVAPKAWPSLQFPPPTPHRSRLGPPSPRSPPPSRTCQGLCTCTWGRTGPPFAVLLGPAGVLVGVRRKGFPAFSAVTPRRALVLTCANRTSLYSLQYQRERRALPCGVRSTPSLYVSVSSLGAGGASFSPPSQGGCTVTDMEVPVL